MVDSFSSVNGMYVYPNNIWYYIPKGAAMTHYHEEEGGQGEQKQVDISDDELKDMIDQLLKDDDLNDDGYVDFYEFVNAQKKTGSQ